MALAVTLLVLGLSAVAKGCLLPPHGCKKAVCDSYSGQKIPLNSGNFSDPSTWTGATYSKLAFVRSSFNKNLGTLGPSAFSAAAWKQLLNGYNGKGAAGPPALPSVNYEFYDLSTGVRKQVASSVVTAPDGKKYNGNASLSDCCHACRVTYGCPTYAFVPSGVPGELTSKAGGTCYFVFSGVEGKDGPFDFTDGTNQYSPRTNNLKAPKALNKTESASKLSSPSRFPSFTQLFLGGYCNPWKYPNGTVTDDPHFTGAHGTRFDFNGELNKAFCLLTDRHLSINALLRGYQSDNTFGATQGADGKAMRSWIKELGFVWTDGRGAEHTLHLVARAGKEQARGSGFLASAALDGAAIPIPAVDETFAAHDLRFSFLGSTKRGWYDIDRFEVRIGSRLELGFNMRIAHPKLQTPTDAQVHFNVMLNDVKVSPSVHGVLGQTYRDTPQQLMKAIKYSQLNHLLGGPVKADGASGKGFLEGQVQDYEASNVLKPDCRMSTYDV